MRGNERGMRRAKRCSRTDASSGQTKAPYSDTRGKGPLQAVETKQVITIPRDACREQDYCEFGAVTLMRCKVFTLIDFQLKTQGAREKKVISPTPVMLVIGGNGGPGRASR